MRKQSTSVYESWRVVCETRAIRMSKVGVRNLEHFEPWTSDVRPFRSSSLSRPALLQECSLVVVPLRAIEPPARQHSFSTTF
jgi:hypothetical protein